MSSVKHTYNFDINQPIGIIFPLFSPEGEKKWVPHWDYKNLMGTTDLYEDYVFLTQSHDHASADAIWLIKRYFPEQYFIQFYRVEPEEKVGIVTVQCTEVSAGSTHIDVTYEYIALSKSGQKFIDSFTRETYRHFIEEWKFLLEHYFEEPA